MSPPAAFAHASSLRLWLLGGGGWGGVGCWYVLFKEKPPAGVYNFGLFATGALSWGFWGTFVQSRGPDSNHYLRTQRG